MLHTSLKHGMYIYSDALFLLDYVAVHAKVLGICFKNNRNFVVKKVNGVECFYAIVIFGFILFCILSCSKAFISGLP